jgi:hypothetical protein
MILSFSRSGFSRLLEVNNIVWMLGIPIFLIGGLSRAIAVYSDSYVSFEEVSHLVALLLLSVSWICLKPEEGQNIASIAGEVPSSYPQNLANCPHLQITRKRMQEIQDYHVISQTHVLPYSYLCQIYHLLNLKHLETVHNFSLGSLRVVGVSQASATDTGGYIKFQTVLDSPFNILRMWRQPVVEVELTLHSRYTVELSIPAYAGKRMIVLFNSFPIEENLHELSINIYTDLRWPRPVMQFCLHLASLMTLYEDLPYLKNISKNVEHLFRANRNINHEAMWLIKRFRADL